MNKLNKTLIGLAAASITIACGGNTEEPNKEKEATKETIPAFDISQIDSTVHPCEDFEHYAVGNWLKNNPVPESESRWGSFSVLDESNKEKIKAIIKEATNANGKKGSYEQQVGDFYASAMDSTKADELGIKPIEPLMAQIDAVTNVQELVETMTKMRRAGSGSIFSYYVHIDSKNSTQHITYVGQGGLGLPDRGYYTPKDERGEMILNEYEKHIAALFKLAGEDDETAAANAKSVVELESILAKNSMDKTVARNPELTYNKMTLDELQKLNTAIDWRSFFESAGIKGIDEVVVRHTEYIQKLDMAFKKPINTWKTYMKWHLLNDMASNLSSDFEQQKFDFYATTMRGTKQMKPRWKRALEKCDATVGEQLGKLFVEKHFPEESKQQVLDMIANINEVFKERVKELEWMGDSTKMKAMEKLSKFTYKIGYPDKWEDYSSVDIAPDALAQNVMNMNEFGYNHMINKIGKPIDKGEWGMNPQTINAYYNPTMNEIVFPAAILQPPFFNPDADDAINYGGIGGVIGHEFSHGFDDQGSKYDGDGNLNMWWTDEDREKFSQLTAKLVNQFDKYEVAEGNHVQGALTLGENIADIAGITLSYYALEKAMKNKKDPMIDGFTYQQRFFLGWAQVWHTNATDEFLIWQVKNDYHSPTRFRTIGPLTNMLEFSSAFGCKEGAMVAPDSLRVKIW